MFPNARIKSFLAILLVWAAVVVLPACSSMGINETDPNAQPQTVKQRVAALEVDFASVVQSAVQLRQAGVIDDEMKERLTPLFNRTARALDAAHLALDAGELDKAQNQIALVNRLLLEIYAAMPSGDDSGG